jgi:hypothetical protein
MVHLLGRGSRREAAAEDGHEPFVGVGQTVLRPVTGFKSYVDLYGFSCLGCASSHGVLLGGSGETAQFQYRTAREHREIPGHSWRASALAGDSSRILMAVWQYCRRGERSPLRDPDLAPGFQDLLDEMEHGGVLDAPGNLLQAEGMPDRVEVTV